MDDDVATGAGWRAADLAAEAARVAVSAEEAGVAAVAATRRWTDLLVQARDLRERSRDLEVVERSAGRRVIER